VTHGTTARVTCGMSVHIIWDGYDMEISYRVMAYTWANYVVTSVSFMDKLYGATCPSHGLPHGTPLMVGMCKGFMTPSESNS
jgi:hypothetical protein